MAQRNQMFFFYVKNMNPKIYPKFISQQNKSLKIVLIL